MDKKKNKKLVAREQMDDLGRYHLVGRQCGFIKCANLRGIMTCDLCENEAVAKRRNVYLCQECLEETEESDYQYEKQSYFNKER